VSKIVVPLVGPVGFALRACALSLVSRKTFGSKLISSGPTHSQNQTR
jgi:hypothetical protein